MRSQLLCTFTQTKNLTKTIDEIVDGFDILYNKIFVLTTDNRHELVCSYNVDATNMISFLPGTILVHRKKESNTLYTINALNAVIRQVNNGILDTSYPIDWNLYRNSLLVTNDDGYRKINTGIFDIVYVKVKK